MNNGLDITIRGCSGSGKSTIAHFIAQCLAQAGVYVELIDADGVSDEYASFTTLKEKKIKCYLKTVQARRK